MKKRLLSAFLMLFIVLILSPSANATDGGFSNDDLCVMTRQYYQDNNGVDPQYVEVDHEEQDTVVIHLYDFVNGHTATYDWYYINRYTAKGTDFMGGEIDLSPYAVNRPEDGSLPFLDVTEADSYYDSVKYVYQNGLFSGISSTVFSPGGSMTRAMLVTVLHRLEGRTPVFGNSRFRDVETGSYYANAVTWASARGIVTGTGGNWLPSWSEGDFPEKTFSPQAPITYEQLAAILYRYAVLFRGMDSAVTVDLNGYAGGNQVGDYAKKAVAWCISKGMITDSSLTPKRSATRAEVASMLYKLSQLKPNSNSGYHTALEALFRNGGDYAENCSVYYDLDNDGSEELFSLYYAAPNKQQRAAVYTLDEGKPSCLLDEEAYGIAGASIANLGVVAKAGRNYICLQEEGFSGDVDIDHNDACRGTYKIYRLSGGKLVLEQKVQYHIILYRTPDYRHYQPNGEIVLLKNGQTSNLRYTEYQSWINSLTWITSVSTKL